MNRRSFLKGGALLATGSAIGAGAAVFARGQSGDANSGSEGSGGAVVRPGLDTPRVFSQVETGETLVALTFDDGPSVATTALLDVLDRHQVRATFNIVGNQVRQQTELLRRQMVRHDIGNHTWSHRPLAGLTASEIDAELRRTDDLIDRITGERPRYLRPPGGTVTPQVLTAASAFGYDVLLWSVQLPSLDRRRDPVQYVLDNLHAGAIVLMHDSGAAIGQASLDALPKLIDRARELGYVFATVSELVSAGNPVQGDAR